MPCIWVALCEAHQNANPPYPLKLLRPRRERPRRRTAEQREELATPLLIELHFGPLPARAGLQDTELARISQEVWERFYSLSVRCGLREGDQKTNRESHVPTIKIAHGVPVYAADAFCKKCLPVRWLVWLSLYARPLYPPFSLTLRSSLDAPKISTNRLLELLATAAFGVVWTTFARSEHFSV
jgi:hypothetical protein